MSATNSKIAKYQCYHHKDSKDFIISSLTNGSTYNVEMLKYGSFADVYVFRNATDFDGKVRISKRLFNYSVFLKNYELVAEIERIQDFPELFPEYFI